MKWTSLALFFPLLWQEETVEVRGTILDVRGLPASDAILVFRGAGDSVEVRTDERGEYRVRIPSGNSVLEIHRMARHGLPDVQVSGLRWKKEQDRFDFPISGRTNLQVRAETREGKFIPGLRLLATATKDGLNVRAVLSADSDRYVAPSAGDGKVSLTLLDAAGTVFEGVHGSVISVENPVRLVAALADRTIRGTVVGDPKPRVTYFHSQNALHAVLHGTPLPSVDGDVHGKFVIPALPATRYAALVRVPLANQEETFDGPQHAGPNSGLPLYLGLDGGIDLREARDHSVEFRMPKVQMEDLASLRGKVVERASGKGLKAIEVLLFSGPDDLILCDTQYVREPLGPMPIVKMTLSDGGFRIRRLLPGRYTFLILDRSGEYAGRLHRVTLGAGASGELNVALDRAVSSGSIAGKLEGASGRVFAMDLERGLAVSTFVDSDGSFELRELPAGTYRLRFVENTPLIGIATEEIPEIAVTSGKPTSIQIKVQ